MAHERRLKLIDAGIDMSDVVQLVVIVKSKNESCCSCWELIDGQVAG